MRPIDNVEHAIGEALAERLDLSRMAVTAWREPEVIKLDTQIVRALGRLEPEISIDDIYPKAIVGSVTAIVSEHIIGNHGFATAEDLEDCESKFAELIRHVGETQNEEFLQQARRHVHGAIMLSVGARLHCVLIDSMYHRARREQSLSFCMEVADYWRKYKHRRDLLDTADLLGADTNPITTCTLCLLDRTGMPPLAVQALRRLLPKAFFVSV